MEITWIGALLIPVGAFYFFLAPNLLYYATIFSIPFAATSLLNSASGSPVFAVQYFGSLFILRYWGEIFLTSTLDVKKKNFKREFTSLFLLWLFSGTVLATMIMPYIIGGGLTAIRGEGVNAEVIDIALTSTTITQVLPVLFGSLLATVLATRITTPTLLRKTLRVYAISVVFVALWGVLQFFLVNVIHVPYPSWIFNTSVTETTLGYMSETAEGFIRISSVSFEPSMLVKQLLVIIPLLWYGILVRTALFTRTWDWIIFILLVAVILLSAATTGFIGVPLFFVLTSFVMFRRGSTSLISIFFYFVVSCGLLVGAYYLLPNAAVEIINEMLINKSESNSASVRFLSVLNAWDYFIKYPVLGVGWAFVTSHDLVFNLLANSGVLGLSAFFLMSLQPPMRTLALLKRLPAHLEVTVRPAATYTVGLVVAHMVTLILGLIGGYEFYLAYPYVTLGLLYAANSHLAFLIKNGEGKIQSPSGMLVSKVVQ